jgi:mono/diheme cytochrome c family protein
MTAEAKRRGTLGVVVLAGLLAGLPPAAWPAPGHPSTATPPPDAAVVPIRGDRSRGEALFAAKCAGCHGAKGIGSSAAPPLKSLRTRRSADAAIVWIKDPQPPMPKLYPKPLSIGDVDDIVAYLESL